MGRPKGSKNTLESRQRMSEARTGEGNSFYGKHHTAEFKQKRCNEGNPMFGRHHSLESRQSIGGTLKQKWTKPEFRDSMTQSFQEHGNGVSTRFVKGNNVHLGFKNSDESKKLMSESHMGQTAWNKGLTKETDPRVAKVAETLVQFYRDHPEEVERISDFNKKLWLDPVFVQQYQERCNRAPNKFEEGVQSIIHDLCIPYKYTGNGQFVIGGKNPDFVNTNGQKKIIEALGCYWHGCPEHFPDEVKQKESEDRIQLFKSFGYSTLGIWEHELKDIKSLKCKILKFDHMV